MAFSGFLPDPEQWEPSPATEEKAREGPGGWGGGSALQREEP